MKALDPAELTGMLDRLKLTAIRDQLDTLLDEAARSEMTLREALGFLAAREIARRDERRISMASKIAQFPFVRELDGFEWSAQPSLDPRQIRELATCRWIAHGDTTLFLGPPGTGKTHLAVALGREAIRQNCSVQFITAATLVATLAKAHADGALEKQLTIFVWLERQIAEFVDDQKLRPGSPPRSWTACFTTRPSSPSAETAIGSAKSADPAFCRRPDRPSNLQPIAQTEGVSSSCRHGGQFLE